MCTIESEDDVTTVTDECRRPRPGDLIAIALTAALLALPIVACGQRAPESGDPPSSSSSNLALVVSARFLRPIAHLVAHPIQRWIRRPHDLVVPVLTYHDVGLKPSGPMSAGNPRGEIQPLLFARQLLYLVSHGYHAVTLRQLYAFWYEGGRLPAKPIVLTFDDGYPNDFRIVAPLLRSLRWPTVLFLVVDRIGRRDGLTLAQLRALAHAGWEIDSHTITHRDLTDLTPVQLNREVSGSRAILEYFLRVPVDFFCFPRGRYDGRVLAAVRLAGYRGATSDDGGLAAPRQRFTLLRIATVRSEPMWAFAYSLKTGFLPDRFRAPRH